ncbi:LppA family lipoprotein [Mycolicibacterium baixiangningiae]|uniref:LppA family lipoprotein n=1 Tax=Mycolicibacterium baixiangningiae TaxID=2761578 RepID=UPI001E45D100|nr:LppA family lipoprotein [Mycolicibacterium baixiangningiae]
MRESRVPHFRRRAAAVLTALVFTCGCGGGGGGDYDSPIVNEEIPVADIAELPDIEQTRSQMLELIERVRAEVSQVVPASAPWQWAYDEARSGCTQEATGHKGTSLYFAKLTSPISFDDQQWDLVYPAVQRMAAEAGLTEVTAMANSTGNHDVRFSSQDGRTLVFGSREASLITGSIACRRSAGSAAP